MDLQEQSQVSILEMARRLKTAFGKYWFLAFPPAMATMLLVLAIAMKLPNYYTSSFIIYIQPQQITTNLIGTQERDQQSERFDAMIKELVSRPRLLSIIQRFNLYPELRGIEAQDKALKRFRSAHSIDNVASLFGQNPNISPTFKVNFSHRDPQKTHQVVEELRNIFVEESLVSQASETRGTEEFFTAELKSIQKKLEEIETKRQDYVRANANRLPERREKLIFDQRDLQNKISANTQLVMANEARYRYLQQELEMTVRDPQTAAQASGAGLDAVAASGTSLPQLKRSLTVLQGKYSDKHPEVVALKKRIEAMEREPGRRVPESAGAGTFENTRESRSLRRQISELQVQNELLKSETSELKERLEQLDKEIQAMPIKEHELIQIERNYATQKEIYDRLVLEKEQASLRSNLIKSQRGSQLRIIEEPAKPQEPAGPPRMIIAAAGIVIGVVIFLAIPLCMFFFNAAFKFRKEVESTLDLPVLGVIPPLSTPGVVSSNRKAFMMSLMASFFTFCIGAVLILFLV